MKALELAEAAVDFSQEGELIHLCSSHAICSLLADSSAELRRLAEVNAELLEALKDAQNAMMDASGCSMPAARELSGNT